MVPAIGTTVRLKPARSAAYGADPAAEYIVIGVKPRPGYKVPWICLREFGFVKPSEIR